MSLLLAVWREVGRHLVIDEAVQLIAPLLRQRFPVEGVAVRRLELARMRVETVATAWLGETSVAADRREGVAALPSAAPEALSRWMRAGGLLRGVPAPGDPLREVVGFAWWRGDLLAGVLAEQGHPTGVLVLLGPRGGFEPVHLEAAAQLIEPLTVALANDGRLAEMRRLREALEADRRALLARLERQDVSDAIVGAETGLREVMEQVERVAATDVPVLLLGETGTGKEVVAREIHKRSPRAAGPIERINCGAIPPGLVDSELFGHERGSFTGAVSARKGWFERADGGTLFLDEIGELPLEAQVRLLRVLQDGTFERVGGQSTLRVDVRIVAATHRDLREMVASGAFRQDLWFRLNVFPISIPPLRERPEDIPALAAHFGWRAGRRLGRGPLAPTPEDLELLVSYSWPGNVRELAAVIERAAILGNGERLDIAGALGRPAPAAAAGRSGESAPRPDGPRGQAPASVSRLETLDEAMAAHIERALAITRGRIEGEGGAARLLGINPHTLRSRMRKLGVDWRRFRTRAPR